MDYTNLERKKEWKNPSSYYHLKYYSKSFLSVHCGGTRAGKSYSILTVIAEFCYVNKNKGLIVSIVRKSGTVLKRTVYKDFIKILVDSGWYNEKNHNRTDKSFNLFGNTVQFMSFDDPESQKGVDSDILFLNEITKIDYENYFQLFIRTKLKVIVDYNPSFTNHYIEKEILDKDADYFVTTYKDNPFLPEAVINNIERLKELNPRKWQIYGLGKKSQPENIVYPNHRVINNFSDMVKNEEDFEVFYGLDFGFHNPSALVKCYQREKKVYLKQEIYKTGLTNTELLKEMECVKVNKRKSLYADSAEPDRIKELIQSGYNAKKSKKDTRDNRIQFCKDYEFILDHQSPDLIREFSNYVHEIDKNDETKILEEVDKSECHLIDGVEYGVYTHNKRTTVERLF